LIFAVLERWLLQLRKSDSSFVFKIKVAVLLRKIVGKIYSVSVRVLKSSEAIGIIWRNSIFQDVGRPPSWILKIAVLRLEVHTTYIQSKKKRKKGSTLCTYTNIDLTSIELLF